MPDNDTRGGAAPALAAHSKDASVPGQTPASSTKASPPASTTGHGVKTAGDMKNLDDAATKVRDIASEYGGRAAEKASDYVQTQPLFALAVTGLMGMIIGAMLARR